MHLISGPLSLFSYKVEIALIEKGLAYEKTVVPFTQTGGYEPRNATVLRVNPKRQVPVLVDGDVELFDSTVILEYLEDAYPVPALYPADPAGRARCRLLELTADEILLPDLRRQMHRSEPPAADPARRAELEANGRTGDAAMARHFAALEARLGAGPFFCGDTLTVADIALFLMLFWSLRLKGPRLQGVPALAGWYARMTARPSIAAAVTAVAAADRVLSPDLFR